MPFDGADYPFHDRPPRNRITFSDNAISYGIAIFAVVMLLMPISLGAFVDIIRYFRAP